mgnify:CR=1 FL=1
MIDPLLTLSFNIHSQKRVYALLLGSGISKSSGIPTGWEVTIDLIRKLAHVEGESCDRKEMEWYMDKYGKEPDYSKLLPLISTTPASQQLLLKSYFEPTEEEREEGKKLPTLAHKIIAKLVAKDYIKIIITTNFDRLLESALEAEGISPVVISSPDAAKGAPPISHSKCTILKVNGDYLDHRIKNSEKDLSKYDRQINKVLDQIFDEYGLIISGWSGDYDIALRNALERNKSRRYPIYWTGIGKPSKTSQKLIDLHRAHFIKITNADEFFNNLYEKVEALEEFSRPHPISTQASIATLKKYLSDNKQIQLRDFLRKEAEIAKKGIDKTFQNIAQISPTLESATNAMKQIESSCEKLLHLFSNGSCYVKKDQTKAFFSSFSYAVSQPPPSSGHNYVAWNDLKNYPALLLSYVAGISAFLSENYSLLATITSKPIYSKHEQDKNVPVQSRVYTHSVMSVDHGRQLLEGMDGRHSPLSDYLFDIVREFVEPFINNDDHYEKVFDEFEYLWCLLHVDSKQENNSSNIWTPWGSFAWRRQERHGEWIPDQIENILEKSDKNYPLIMEGLFGGSLDRLKKSYEYSQPKLKEISSKY